MTCAESRVPACRVARHLKQGEQSRALYLGRWEGGGCRAVYRAAALTLLPRGDATSRSPSPLVPATDHDLVPVVWRHCACWTGARGAKGRRAVDGACVRVLSLSCPGASGLVARHCLHGRHKRLQPTARLQAGEDRGEEPTPGAAVVQYNEKC